MKRKTTTRFLFTSMAAAIALCWVTPGVLAQTASATSPREAAKTRVKEQRQQLQAATGTAAKVTDTTVMNAQALMGAIPPGFQDYSVPNYANSPFLTKFKDALPGLCASATATNCIPVASGVTLGDGSVYYEIGVREYRQQLHSELPSTGTLLRGYYQKNGPDTRNSYLGPVIVAKKDVPVRIKFFNEKAADGKHIIPVDTTVMGAGAFEIGDLALGNTIVGNFGENRSGIHLHGGFTPWISDGTPHQWVSPIGETGDYKEGVSLKGVPDMGGDLAVGNGIQTLYYPNQQSGRLMFYHDHAYGITRLNVYAGEAAGYLLYDSVEENLVNTNVLPNLGGVYKFGIPLVIQDKSFVHAGSTVGAATIPATTVSDPTWTQVGGSTAPGDLWFPHVYVPNQDPYGLFSTSTPDGMNMMGRWDYGPWIWPPAAAQVPDTLPNPSIVPEAFMDTMLVNGKAYPFFNVNRRAYRFRVLNASNDRFMNLQLYYAFDPTSGTNGKVCSGQSNAAACTEIRMVPRDGKTYTVSSPGELTVTSTVPDDAFRGSVPDPTTAGPKMLQIGNEGGFLPQAIVRNNPPVPITYDTDPKSMTVGNVKAGTIILGPAERADIIIDFSKVPGGSSLILYNDAPAAFPAGDPRYDYFTGDADQTDKGGAPSTPIGKGPNTRTIMQFRVQGGNALPVFDFAKLQAELPKAYAQAQDRPHVPQPDYNVGSWSGQYPTTPNYARIFDKDTFTFRDVNGNAVTLPIHNKAIAEEFDPAYGRMSALLGTEAQITNNQGQNTFGFMYVDPSTENLPAGVTQIWKITHNGVDTHAIHWHLLNVQVINRVDWAGVVKAPDPDELGWKETVRMNPLEDIIVAVQAKAPVLPAAWGPLPDSVRPKDVTQPIGSMMGFTQPWPYVAQDPTKQPEEFMVSAVNPVNTMNEMTNFGWEYVWHCHLLGHEENDMMRPLVMTQVSGGVDAIAPVASAALSPAPNAAGWNNTPVSLALSATDNAAGALTIEYSIDNGVNFQTYTGPIALTAETPLAGTTIQYKATDAAGNVSPTGSALVKIDLTAPVFNVAPTAAKTSNSVTIAGTAADALSGLVTGTGAGTWSMTGPATSTSAGPTATGTFSIAAGGSFSFSRNKLKNGAYSVTVGVKDVAGNVQTATIGFTIP